MIGLGPRQLLELSDMVAAEIALPKGPPNSREIVLPAMDDLIGHSMHVKSPYRDGTTDAIFAPLDFIARLAALVPKPRVNLTRFHGGIRAQ